MYNLTIYRPSNTVTLMLFIELLLFSPDPWASEYLCEKYTGCFGTESGVNSFSNMNTTDDMRGLLFGLSCTHNSPMWMQRKTSVGKQVSTGMSPLDQLPYRLAIGSTPEPMYSIS
jgi:hypothetical protein